MSRRARLAAFAIVASLAVSAASCTNLTGPTAVEQAPDLDENQGSNTD